MKTWATIDLILALVLIGCTPTEPSPCTFKVYGTAHDSGADTVFVVPCENNNAHGAKGG